MFCFTLPEKVEQQLDGADMKTHYAVVPVVQHAIIRRGSSAGGFMCSNKANKYQPLGPGIAIVAYE